MIALTETWINDKTCDADEFNIPGYVKFNLNRKSKIGGGVCIYIKDNIKAKIRNDITSECNTSNIESIFIELLNPKEKNIILGLVYRPPNNMYKDFEEKIESALIAKPSLRLLDLTLSKTRFSSHLSFLSRSLRYKVIPITALNRLLILIFTRPLAAILYLVSLKLVMNTVGV